MAKGLKCVKCGKIAGPARLSFQGQPIDGWKCGTCGSEYFNPVQAEQILALNKLRHEELEAKLGRMRSNLILRIPRSVERALNLTAGEIIKLKVLGKHKLELAV